MRHWRTLAFSAVVGLAVAWLLVVATRPRPITAPELARAVGSEAPVPAAMAPTLCPAAPDWALVAARPAAYRGRCVYLVGFPGPRHGPIGTVFRMDLPRPELELGAAVEPLRAPGAPVPAAPLLVVPANQPAGTVWIDVGSGAGQQVWTSDGPGSPIGVLGTLQGLSDGVPLVRAADIYIQSADGVSASLCNAN
jgi:hypothetical protein